MAEVVEEDVELMSITARIAHVYSRINLMGWETMVYNVACN